MGATNIDGDYECIVRPGLRWHNYVYQLRRSTEFFNCHGHKRYQPTRWWVRRSKEEEEEEAIADNITILVTRVLFPTIRLDGAYDLVGREMGVRMRLIQNSGIPGTNQLLERLRPLDRIH